MGGWEQAEDVGVVEAVDGSEAIQRFELLEDGEAGHGVDGSRLGCWTWPVGAQGHCEYIHLVFARGVEALGSSINACTRFIEGDGWEMENELDQ